MTGRASKTITPDILRSYLRNHSPRRITSEGLHRAAVLFPFVQEEHRLQILLTKRTDFVEHHKGQVSFPGGMKDPGDVDAVATALRESEEEIGLRRPAVEVLGEIDDYETPSGFVITPVVGLIRQAPPFAVNEAEVEEVFFVPVDFFLTAETEELFQREWKGQVRDVYAYQYGRHRIWGVTAAIIRSFLRQLPDEGR